MKRTIALLCFAALAACGGGGSSDAPSIAAIQVQNLYYGASAQFVISGNNLQTLSGSIGRIIPNCSGQTPIFATATEQAIRCTVTAVGDMQVQVQNPAGAVIFTKTFTVPPPQVTLTTSMGNIVVELDPKAAPLSVNNFLRYVQTGFYANTIFHRVIAGFVIQGGGFAPGPAVQPGTLAPIALESNNGLSNLRGTLAMARTSDPNSATSQFYFNLADNVFLDYQDASNPGYAVFGKITQGLDVMDAIGAVATRTVDGVPDVPVTDVVVTTAVRLQ